VDWQLTPELPKIMADPGRLEQVFINLLINARDAITAKLPPPAGEISSDRIVITTRQEEARVICEVCDSGIGLPEGMSERLFEPFFTTKEPGKGTGLGLSISYGIVKECGGTIRARPFAGGGACIVLAFPIPESSSTQPTAPGG
jgi:histidine kinase